jgi:hypothetical protein
MAPNMATTTTAAVAALLCAALAAQVAHSYTCDGNSCCNYQCTSGCVTTSTGAEAPSWWLRDNYESCAQKVSLHYDPTVACSAAVHAFNTRAA